MEPIFFELIENVVLVVRIKTQINVEHVTSNLFRVKCRMIQTKNNYFHTNITINIILVNDTEISYMKLYLSSNVLILTQWYEQKKWWDIKWFDVIKWCEEHTNPS